MAEQQGTSLQAYLACKCHSNPVPAPWHHLLHLLQLSLDHHLPTGQDITAAGLRDTDVAAQPLGTFFCGGGGQLGAVQQLRNDQVKSTLLVPEDAVPACSG